MSFIDVLFRSAAAAYDGFATGIIRTGLMEDGAAGMWAIKRCGGTTIVQDPNEAEYPDMPLSVLNRMEVNYCVSLSGIGAVLEKVVQTDQITRREIPPDIRPKRRSPRKWLPELKLRHHIEQLKSLLTSAQSGEEA